MQMTEFVMACGLLKPPAACKDAPIPSHPGAAKG